MSKFNPSQDWCLQTVEDGVFLFGPAGRGKKVNMGSGAPGKAPARASPGKKGGPSSSRGSRKENIAHVDPNSAEIEDLAETEGVHAAVMTQSHQHTVNRRRYHATHHQQQRHYWRQKAANVADGDPDDGSESHAPGPDEKLTKREEAALKKAEKKEADDVDGSKAWLIVTNIEPDEGVARGDEETSAAGLLPAVKEEHQDDVEWSEEGDSQRLYVDKIEAADVLQGQLGDCWLLSATAALAEYEGLVEAVFKVNSRSKYGDYTVRLCKSGRWIEVKVDDRLPMKNDGSGAIYARSHSGELWVQLLEKAFAKLHGGYAAIAGGFPNEAMVDLTGCPGMSFPFSGKKVAAMLENGGEEMWAKLSDWDSRGYVCTCTTSGKDERTAKGDTSGSGLVDGHAYTMIGVHDCMDAGGVRLVNVRNPWGTFEWDGDWSDTSDLWDKNPKVKKQVKPKLDKEDGSFWMSWEDFMSHFDSVEVCAVKRDTSAPWKQIRMPSFFELNNWSSLRQPYPSRMYHLTTTTDTHLYIACHQEDARMETAAPHYHLGLYVYSLDGKTTYAQKQSIQRACQVDELDLPKGEYLVRILAFAYYQTKGPGAKRTVFPQGQESVLPRHFVMTVHSDQDVEFEDCPKSLSPWK